MTRQRSWGSEWVAATLAPWTIAPHPNFRVSNIDAAASLALVTDMRWEDFALSDDLAPWAADLLKASRESLLRSTQRAAVDRLWVTALDRAVQPGARAAAAILAGVGASELEESDLAVEKFAAVAEELGLQTESQASGSSSGRLTVAALRLHRALRLMEIGRRDHVLRELDLVARWLPSATASDYDQFAVSAGISWDAVRVQRDIVEALRLRSLALRATAESIEGQTWTEVVRGRSGWIDTRLGLRGAERDAIVLRDTFEDVIEANSKTQHFGRSTAVGAGYRALLLAELGADYSRVLSCRESQAKVLLVDSARKRTGGEGDVREALRLLRHAGATKALRSALRWVRTEGPTVALVEEAGAVIGRALRTRTCSESDLLLLENSAEFMSPEMRDRAISTARGALQEVVNGHRNQWVVRSQALKALTRLLPDSSSHQTVAADALLDVQLHGVGAGVADILARLIAAIDWAQVDSPVSDSWRELLDVLDQTDDSPLLQAISAALSPTESSTPPQGGLEHAAYLVDNASSEGVTNDVINADAEAILAALEREIDNAKNGSIAFGGMAPANVAAAFAIRFDDARVWDGLIAHLCDMRVDAVLKSLALDRIARLIEDVPDLRRGQLRAAFSSIKNSARSEYLLEGSRASVFAEAFRLELALGLATKAEAMLTLLALASGRVPDRIESARAIPYALALGDADWGHAMLLQLTKDSDPTVRSEAARALAEMLCVESGLAKAAYERVRELMATDGIRVPLGALWGVQQLIAKSPPHATPLLTDLEEIAESGGNTTVRGAARVALEMYSATES